jgi:hypothetical protein
MSGKAPEYAIRPNRILKENAQKVFGKKVVSEAYVCVPWHDGYGHDMMRDSLNLQKFEKQEDIVDIDAKTVILVINDIPIQFASEWCMISRIDMKTTKILERK